jgi:hypothetical protein
MRKIFTFSFLLGSFSMFGQESQFMGYVTPTVSNLIPASKNQVEPKNQVIKPNFKGRDLIEVDNTNTHNPDWVWQQHQNTEKIAAATVVWQFQGLGTNLSPPDPTVDADSNVVIQSTNSNGGSVYRIFNKNTGATIASSLTMQTLGGSAGAGDPIVLYYKPARRWFLMEFSSTGNKLLVHVSQTSNPQGSYYTYSFTCTSFPDYPKWSFCQASDAFLVTTNQGGPPTTYAMKLSTLLTGATSPFIKIAIGYSLNGFGFQSITPVDLEGDNAAPTGMKPLFVRHRDDESHTNGTPDSGTNDWIELWEMTINWTASTATVTKIQDISIAEIDSKLCGLTSFACIKQPGTTNTLDPLRETVMYKAPMRVFGTHQAMVLALSTDVDGADRSGVRWVELRRATGVTTATWTKYQEGTYAPGTGTSRWMPAINIDKNGNIIMAYSTSSNTTGDFPSIKMTGRKPCDPLGTMTVPETTIIAGTSSKTGDTRWGDYHHMSIDDFDGLTFYFTGVYHNSSTKTNVSAIRMNPDAKDASIFDIFQVTPGGVCGSSTQLGVVVQNMGTAAITSGVIQWQIGSGALTNVNYTSNQLTSVGSLDTIFVTVTGLVNGSNSVTINSTTVNGTSPDDNICNDTKTYTLTVGAGGFTVNSTVNAQPTCTTNSGQVTLVPTGGTSPFTYALNNGTPQSSATFSNLAAGTYSYTITDNSGCSGTGSVTLSQPASITATSTQSAQITCNGAQNASITASASGGQASYTYSIDGTTYQAGASFSGLGAGTYSVYAKDANGCIGQTSITISQPAVLNLNAVPTMISCFGSANGSISAMGSGGTSPYVYSIDGTTFSSQSVVNNLSAGSYTVTVKDVNGCLQTFNTTITEPTQVGVSGVSTGTATATTNGTITLTGNGGLTPYTYSINGTNYYSGSLFSNLAPGTYTCYVKDNNGCISTTTIIVEELVGLEENGINVIQLYPNPNNGIFELSVEGLSGDKLACKLFNVQGQLVSDFTLDVVNGKATKTIEMSKKLSAGVYYLGLYNSDKAVVRQFIKE